MTLNQLLTFAAIAKHLNLSHASSELHVSQASISQKMRKLEKEFKAELYQRSHRGIVLTEDGATFLGHVRIILKDIRELTERFGARPSRKQPTLLRVGGSFAPSASFLPRMLATFQRQHPSTQLILKTHDSVTLERMLLDSKLDVAVINHRPKSAELVSELYRREKLVVFASANHPLTKKRGLGLRELARAPLVIRDATGSHTLIERMLQETDAAIRPNIVLRCESPAAVKTAVRNNMGIGVLFFSSVKTEIQSGKFKQIKLMGAKLDVQTYIVNRSESLSPAALHFVGILRQSTKG